MKISIIGLGSVGATLAYTLVAKEIGSELVLVDRDADIARGHAEDLQHANLFLRKIAHVRHGDVAQTANSDVIAFCASRPWKEGFTDRLAAADANTRLLEDLIPPLAEHSPNACLLMFTNPVDVLTYHAIRLSGYPAERVMGTGTLIDSARFRYILSQQVEIHPDDLRAYILGEHGNSQFPALSIAQAGGERIETNQTRQEMFEQAMQAGVDVLKLKGHTNFAIAMAGAAIIECIAADERRTFPISVRVDDYLGVRDVCLSVPVVVGRSGVARRLEPQLSEKEGEAFRRSAQVIREVIDQTMPK